MIRQYFFVLGFILSALTTNGEQAVTTQISTQNVGEYNVMDVMPKGDSKEDKLFREALLSGREYGKYYSLFSDNNKKFNVDKLVKYCKEHNYSFFSVGKKPVKEFYFMPNELLPAYEFEFNDNSGMSFDSLTQKGSVYFYKLYIDFILLDGALWSGNIVNGKVDGTGTGFYFTDYKGLYYYFTGTFKEGVPQGKVIYHVIGGGWPLQIKVGDWHEGMASFQVSYGSDFSGGGYYGFLTMNGDTLSVALQPEYVNVISDFQDGKAAVVRKIITRKESILEEIIIDKSGNFIDYSGERKRQQLQLEEKQYRQYKELFDNVRKNIANYKSYAEDIILNEKTPNLSQRIVGKHPASVWGFIPMTIIEESTEEHNKRKELEEALKIIEGIDMAEMNDKYKELISKEQNSLLKDVNQTLKYMDLLDGLSLTTEYNMGLARGNSDNLTLTRNFFSVLGKAKESARELKDTSTGKLHEKYAKAKQKLDACNEELYRIINRAASKHTERDKQKSNGINWDRSKEPSGKISYRNGLFSNYKTHEKDGVLYTREGGYYCHYNICYDSNNKKVRYVIRDTNTTKVIQREFKSLGELEEYFLKAIK